MIRARRTLGLMASLVIGGTLVAGCTPARPEVTFYGNRTAVTAEPAGWCDADLVTLTGDCALLPENSASLTLRPGDPVQISIDPHTAAAPWLVVFRYIDSAGAVQEARTPVFEDHRLAYSLWPPTKADLIIHVEVHGVLVPTAQGFQPTQIWVLVATPAAPRPAPHD